MPKVSSKSEDNLSSEFFSQDDIFSLEALKSFKPAAYLTHMIVSGSHAVVATVKNMLMRFPLLFPTKITEIEITRSSDDRVHNLFVDPMGWHTIISMQSGFNFYTNPNMKRVRLVSRARDLLIDSVAWSPNNTSESSTQAILVGTNDGLIFETVLLSDEGRFISNTPEQYWKQVATLGHSVTGLEIIHLTLGSASALFGEAQRCVILATTPSRMYQFAGWINASGTGSILSHLTVGSPQQSVVSALGTENILQVGPTPVSGLFPIHSPGLYQSVFTPEDKLPAGSKVTEFPQNFGYSDLKVFRAPGDEVPSTFAWMTGPGIYFGYLNTYMLSLPPFSLLSSKADGVYSPSHDDDDHFAEKVDDPVDATDIDVKHPEDVFSGRVINFTRGTKLISYPIIRMLEHTSSPLGICLTAFHIIIAYADRLKAVNVLDDQTVYSMPVASELGIGQALGIGRDHDSGTVWLAGTQGVARLNVTNETVRVWRIYLDRSQFDEARKFCQNESQLDAVTIREAESYFSQGDFTKSAELFAQTSIPFEEAALKFSQLSLVQRFASGSPPILQGLAVTSDHDIMDSILHGTEPEDLLKVHPSTQKKLSKDDPISTSNPLKAFISAKLRQLFLEKAGLGRRFESSAVSENAGSSLRGKIALLVLWLAELQLTEIGYLRDRAECYRDSDSQRCLQAVRQEFKESITQPEALALLPEAKDLLYRICDSHGNNDELVFLAEIAGDFNRLVDHYMGLGSYELALNTMTSHKCLPRLYDHATTLVMHCPEQTVNAWLRLGKLLDPVKLLPAIMLLPSTESLRYLRFVVEKCNSVDQAVHHLLISLSAEEYVRIKESSTRSHIVSDPLMVYFESASSQALNIAHLEGHQQLVWCDGEPAQNSFNYSMTLSGTSVNSPNFDVDQQLNSLVFPEYDNQHIQSVLPYDPGFALRTCKEVGHLQGTVFILKLMGLHKQALQAAIDHNDIPLAKEIAENDILSQDMRRQLWIILARHLISKQNNIQEATNLLRECPLLKLEDLLPYFPDFVTVDQFKDAICASLDSYHQRIEEVKHEMHFIMRSTDALRRQLDGVKSRYVQLQTDSRCTHCNYLLLTRSFYFFSCGHQFHTDCLIEIIYPHLKREQREEMIGLLEKQRSEGSAYVAEFQNRLDRLIAADCVVCGQVAISAVSDLFFEDQSSYESHLAIWS